MRTMRSLKLSLVAFCFCTFWALSAQASPIVVPLPLTSPVFISLADNPIVTIGTRTIDFSPNLSQEFIDFTPVGSPDSSFGVRDTVGVRVRDGLASISGIFPASPDPSFVNALPAFINGTTDLLLFDLVIPSGQFSITLTDLEGDVHTAQFAVTPEPATGVVLLSVGAVRLVWFAWRRRRLG